MTPAEDCPCGHEDDEHVHYCSTETEAGSCGCAAEYARLRLASDHETTYEADGALVAPWRITDPWEGYVPRIGDRIVPHEPYAHLGEIIELQTPEDFAALPDGTLLISISGEEKVKGRDSIDLDTRFGRIAWGLPDRRASRNPR